MAFIAFVVSVAAAVSANGAMRERRATLGGQWQVGPVVDTTHQALPSDLAAQLARARMPLPGQIVRTVLGKLCVGSTPCDEVTWTEIPLADSQYGEGLKQTLGLAAQTPVYEGDTGNRFIGYTLIGRLDHTLMALVTICQDSYHARGCRNAYEVWRPASPDAKMTLGSPRR